MHFRARMQHKAGMRKVPTSDAAVGLAKLGGLLSDARMISNIWGTCSFHFPLCDTCPISSSLLTFSTSKCTLVPMISANRSPQVFFPLFSGLPPWNVIHLLQGGCTPLNVFKDGLCSAIIRWSIFIIFSLIPSFHRSCHDPPSSLCSPPKVQTRRTEQST